MKLQFEIDVKYAEDLEHTCKAFNGIDLENTEEKGCTIALLNNDAFICKGFIKNGCPLIKVKE